MRPPPCRKIIRTCPGGSARRAEADLEARVPDRWQRLCDDRVDACERRRVVAERGSERIQSFRCALGLDHDSLAVVQHESGECKPTGEPVDEPTEPDTLHDTVDAEPAALLLSHPAILAPPRDPETTHAEAAGRCGRRGARHPRRGA